MLVSKFYAGEEPALALAEMQTWTASRWTEGVPQDELDRVAFGRVGDMPARILRSLNDSCRAWLAALGRESFFMYDAAARDMAMRARYLLECTSSSLFFSETRDSICVRVLIDSLHTRDIVVPLPTSPLDLLAYALVELAPSLSPTYQFDKLPWRAWRSCGFRPHIELDLHALPEGQSTASAREQELLRRPLTLANLVSIECCRLRLARKQIRTCEYTLTLRIRDVWALPNEAGSRDAFGIGMLTPK